jgi:hypothetical protein
VLFLTSIYPDTLLYLSVYAMLRSASAIVGASAVGSAIDSRGRKEVVRTSIGTLKLVEQLERELFELRQVRGLVKSRAKWQ